MCHTWHSNTTQLPVLLGSFQFDLENSLSDRVYAVVISWYIVAFFIIATVGAVIYERRRRGLYYNELVVNDSLNDNIGPVSISISPPGAGKI
jgi:hypothetical protein